MGHGSDGKGVHAPSGASARSPKVKATGSAGSSSWVRTPPGPLTFQRVRQMAKRAIFIDNGESYSDWSVHGVLITEIERDITEELQVIAEQYKIKRKEKRNTVYSGGMSERIFQHPGLVMMRSYYLDPKTIQELSDRFPMPSWAVKRAVRSRGGRLVVEDICEHGIGHPNREWLLSLSEEERDGEGIHGCDKCCWKGLKP